MRRTVGIRSTLFSIVGALGVATLVTGLFGCDAQSSDNERYLQRLANALELDYHALVPVQLPVFPAPAALAIERPAEKINLLEYLQVNRCDLGALVGARNSGLGRMQSPSQRWLYDSRLVYGLRACEDKGLELQRLAATRQAQLGVAAFNALFAGKEWHVFATPPLSEDERPIDTAGLERALLTLNGLVEDSVSGSIDLARMSSLEEQLAVLRFSAALGKQRRAWAEQSAMLEQATRLLLSALATNPACRTGEPTEQGKVRRNVFQRFYVESVQPELARQGQPDRGWLRALSMLVSATVAASRHSQGLLEQATAVQQWHEQVLGVGSRNEYGRWKAAITAHSRAWQRQLRICGLMPGG